MDIDWSPELLLIDDCALVRSLIAAEARKLGLRAAAPASMAEAIDAVGRVDGAGDEVVLLVDAWLWDDEIGTTLLRHARRGGFEGLAVLVTGDESLDVGSARDAGADHVFDYSSDDLADQILGATGGELIDRIVEVEFGQNAETDARVIAERGTIAAFGSARDMAPVMPFYPLMFKAVTLDLVLVYLLDAATRGRVTGQLTALLEQEALRFRISQTFDLADCAKAHDVVADGARAGSVILTV